LLLTGGRGAGGNAPGKQALNQLTQATAGSHTQLLQLQHQGGIELQLKALGELIWSETEQLESAAALLDQIGQRCGRTLEQLG
jgi:hypothetical protein